MDEFFVNDVAFGSGGVLILGWIMARIEEHGPLEVRREQEVERLLHPAVHPVSV